MTYADDLRGARQLLVNTCIVGVTHEEMRGRLDLILAKLPDPEAVANLEHCAKHGLEYEQHRDELAEALREYGSHDAGCPALEPIPAFTGYEQQSCKCGFHAALKRIEEGK